MQYIRECLRVAENWAQLWHQECQGHNRFPFCTPVCVSQNCFSENVISFILSKLKFSMVDWHDKGFHGLKSPDTWHAFIFHNSLSSAGLW